VSGKNNQGSIYFLQPIVVRPVIGKSGGSEWEVLDGQQRLTTILSRPSCVSDRVKRFLHGFGIVTTVEVPGRRAVSGKDLHSMRHVFCYLAKSAGIPENVIAEM